MDSLTEPIRQNTNAVMPEQLDLFDQPIPKVIRELTFNQASRLFLVIHWDRTKMSKKTGALIGHLNTVFDGRLIHTLGRQDIINMRDRLSKMGYGTAYINKAHMLVKLMYNKFEAWKSDGWAEGYNFEDIVLPRKNPASMVNKPKDPARDRFLSPWEFRVLIRVAKRLNDWDMVDTLKLALWLRVSPIDLEEFNDDEINETNWQIQIFRRHTITPRTPKGCIQIIPLKEKIWGLIQRRRQYRNAGEKRILNWSNFKRRFNRLRKAATEENIKPFQLRDFRRSGSGFLWEHGVDAVTVSEGMGHTTTKVWEHHYKPKTRPHLRKSVDILIKAFDG